MNKVIVLLGPTGAGKTRVSILFAKELGAEIISADSMQIYRHMDIGTAKPTPEQRAMVPHHMLDIIEPYESFSTGKYIAMASPVIEGLHRKGKTPFVVGGTGLYIKAMTKGIFSGPSADWSLREELLSMEKDEKGSLYNYLNQLDPEAAGKITPNDTRRIIRALEVSLKSNVSISEMQKKLTRPLPYEFIKIGITRDRRELYRLIEERVDEMFKAGLVEEVKSVMDLIGEHCMSHNSSVMDHEKAGPCPRPAAPYPFPALQAIGYKETARYLLDEVTLEEAARLIKRGTKRYAKRQFTWFRKEEGINWVDITGIYDVHKALEHVRDATKHLF